MSKIVKFIKEQRRIRGMTQKQCALKAGVSLPFLRNLEQGKKSVRIDKVNDVLNLFGYELGPIPAEKSTIN